MTPSAWLSFSVELGYLVIFFSIVTAIAFGLRPLRAFRYWSVRRERDRVAALHRRLERDQHARLDYGHRYQQDLDAYHARFNSAMNEFQAGTFGVDDLRRAELTRIAQAERRIIH